MTELDDNLSEQGDEQVLMGWEKRVRVLFNPAMWVYVLLGFGAGACFVGLLFTALGAGAAGFLLAAILLVVCLVISFIAMLAIDLFGGLRSVFALTTRGARSIAGKAAQGISFGTTVVGILFRSPLVAGAGLLAESEQSLFIEYERVRTVKFNPRRQVILIRKRRLSKPVALYCTDEVFQRALDILRERCPGAVFEQVAIPL
ncbi:MAG: hypothetical protein EHM61_05860 [Acidobacteria bacterium]|nr:MAG: hypothetical protein EHM61_05860 [Acidobacteriota bacterium]